MLFFYRVLLNLHNSDNSFFDIDGQLCPHSKIRGGGDEKNFECDV